MIRFVAKREVLKDDPDHEDEAGLMEFRLTYEGKLPSYQHNNDRNTPARRDLKHEIRRKFHLQLKRLWEITPFLKSGESTHQGYISAVGPDGPFFDIESLAKKHNHFNFNFVPLATSELNPILALEILFLRPDKPGSLWAGDIDNRIKTLIDTLAIPDSQDMYSDRVAQQDEKPFFVLMERDDLLTKLSVETDRLLDCDATAASMDKTKLVITVRLRPYEVHAANIQFA